MTCIVCAARCRFHRVRLVDNGCLRKICGIRLIVRAVSVAELLAILVSVTALWRICIPILILLAGFFDFACWLTVNADARQSAPCAVGFALGRAGRGADRIAPRENTLLLTEAS